MATVLKQCIVGFPQVAEVVGKLYLRSFFWSSSQNEWRARHVLEESSPHTNQREKIKQLIFKLS